MDNSVLTEKDLEKISWQDTKIHSYQFIIMNKHYDQELQERFLEYKESIETIKNNYFIPKELYDPRPALKALDIKNIDQTIEEWKKDYKKIKQLLTDKGYQFVTIKKKNRGKFNEYQF